MSHVKQVVLKCIFSSLAMGNSDDACLGAQGVRGHRSPSDCTLPLGKMQRGRPSARMTVLPARKGQRRQAGRVTGSNPHQAEDPVQVVVALAPWTYWRAPLGAKCFFTPANSVQRRQPSALYLKSSDFHVPHASKS